jgi:hypothetical protein
VVGGRVRRHRGAPAAAGSGGARRRGGGGKGTAEPGEEGNWRATELRKEPGGEGGAVGLDGLQPRNTVVCRGRNRTECCVLLE